MKTLKLYAIAAFLTACFAIISVVPSAQAQRLAFIRDAEIERTLKDLMAPFLEAAGLGRNSVDIYLVKDDRINAFVAGGTNIFFHTGLIQKSDSVEQLAAVIAHEIGHIAGGHLIRTQEQIRIAQIQSTIATILGAGAAIATGDAQIAGAAIGLGTSIAQAGFFSYSRAQESAADQAGVRYMETVGLSPSHAMNFMKKLENQELLSAASKDLYARTHPLTRERISFLRHAADRSNKKGSLPDFQRERFHRMKAKLDGFIKPYNRVTKLYPLSDNSIAARYARAIAHYKRSDLAQALPLLDQLIAGEPSNPFFHELRAQALMEHGRLGEAHDSYAKAVQSYPGSSLLRATLAHVQLELGQPNLLPYARGNIEVALATEPTNASYWSLAGRVYGKEGNIGMFNVTQAEASMAYGKFDQAVRWAQKAQGILPKGSIAWNRAVDLEQTAKRLAEKRR